MALAVILLFGASLMIRSFVKTTRTNAGVRIPNVLTMQMVLPAARYPHGEEMVSFFDRLGRQLKAIPGVESVALANSLPAHGAGRLPYELAGGAPVEAQQRPVVSTLVVGPGYFHTLGATVLAGREFQDADGASNLPVTIVNEKFAQRHWPGEDALGKRFRMFDGKTAGAWLTVVGVSTNISQSDASLPDSDSQLIVYLPYRQKPGPPMWFVARTRVPPESLATAFRHAVQVADPDLPVFGPWTLENRLGWVYRDRSNLVELFALFAGIALLLASVGLYAVVAHSVNQRTQEIGIRMAIGGRAPDILRLVFRQGMLPLAIGLAIGFAGSFALTPILRSMVVQVSTTDPVAFGGAAAVLIFAALLGCWIPARRAMRVDPVIALRHE
jgi:predicted permease